MSQSDLDPRSAIQLFHDGSLAGRELLRCFASYPRWIVPASFGAGGPALLEFRSGGSRHFYLFSDIEAYDAARRAVGESVMGEHYIEMTGDSVWLSFDSDVNALNINPHSPQQIYYKPEQFPRLRRWASTIRVERALDNVLATDDGYESIFAFDGYYLVKKAGDDRGQLQLAPDSRGRTLAAVFTAEDSLEAYVNEMSHTRSEVLEPHLLSGSLLFELLVKAQLDGFVFNCCGPVTPRAFALAFSRRVIEKSGMSGQTSLDESANP
jgi:hypothetical protein